MPVPSTVGATKRMPPPEPPPPQQEEVPSFELVPPLARMEPLTMIETELAMRIAPPPAPPPPAFVAQLPLEPPEPPMIGSRNGLPYAGWKLGPRPAAPKLPPLPWTLVELRRP